MKKKLKKVYTILIFANIVIWLSIAFFAVQKQVIGVQNQGIIQQSHPDSKKQNKLVEYILSFGRKIEKSKKAPIKITFAGDAMFDRHIRTIINKKGDDHIFLNLKPILNSSDLVLINFESPITDFDSISQGSEEGSRENYLFTSPVESAEILKKYNIKLVNVGNNHIFNFGKEGFKQTKKHLNDVGVEFFGYVGTDSEFHSRIKKINESTFTFINYNQFINGSLDPTFVEIKKAKKANADFIIVYAHWGNEYHPMANSRIQNIAHSFVDAGADLVVGSHPHVIQQREIYNDATIYYSLGNFIFDQYFDPATMTGLLLTVTFDPNDHSYRCEEQKIVMSMDGKIELK